MLNTLLSLFLVLMSAAAEAPVGVTTLDGRYLEGSIAIEKVTMNTIFGEVHARVKEIDCMIFSGKDHLILKDGTVFRGSINLDELVLDQRGTKIAIPRAKLATVVVNPGVDSAQSAATTSVTIVALDGRKLTGKVEPIIFEMKTDFGRAEFKLEKVESIRFGSSDRVKTASGTLLEGQIKDFKIRVRTTTDVQTLMRSDIQSIEVSHLT